MTTTTIPEPFPTTEHDNMFPEEFPLTLDELAERLDQYPPNVRAFVPREAEGCPIATVLADKFDHGYSFCVFPGYVEVKRRYTKEELDEVSRYYGYDISDDRLYTSRKKVIRAWSVPSWVERYIMVVDGDRYRNSLTKAGALKACERVRRQLQAQATKSEK